MPGIRADGNGFTALRHAAAHGHPDLARLLLERGADVNTTGHRGWTPLMSAVAENNEEMARLLIDRGADPTIKTDKGISAEVIARHKEYDQLLKFLSYATSRN